MILPIIVVACLFGVVTERGVAPKLGAGGEISGPATWSGVRGDRFHGLPRRRVDGLLVPIATGPRARLLGLAWLDRERAGTGLLIPRCASVHTFGMRFALDLYFLDREGATLAIRREVPPRRLAWCRGARAVLEIPSRPGGESGPGGS
jgi:uncharacterized protein